MKPKNMFPPAAILIILTVCFIIVPLSDIHAQAAFLFLGISPSPRANGMGNAYTAFSSDDPMAAYYNPAFLGAFARKHYFSSGFYPRNVPWLSSFVSGMSYSHQSYNVGFNLKNDLNIPLSIGVGYSRTFLDLGEQVMLAEHTDDQGNPIILGTFQAWDRAACWTVGICLDYYIRVGIGVGFKQIESNTPLLTDNNNDQIKANAVDVGFLLQYPIFESIGKITNHQVQLTPHITPFLVPVFSYSICNIGDEITYFESLPPEPLPRVARTGIGLEGGVTASRNSMRWQLFSFKWASEAEDLLIQRDGQGNWKYRKGSGDIDVFDDLILGNANPAVAKSRGIEINLLDVFTWRTGTHEEIEYRLCYKTNGFGLSLSGLIKALFWVKPDTIKNRGIRFFLERIDVQYHESAWDVQSGPLKDTEFKGISIFLLN
jgi:hypothetical protein